MLIAVPCSAKAGDLLFLFTSTGACWSVPLPPGATHGKTQGLTFPRPPTAAPDERIVHVEHVPMPDSETLDVGGWQVVVTGGHAVLPEGMTRRSCPRLSRLGRLPEQPRLHRRTAPRRLTRR